MIGRLAHRGPDDEGVWTDAEAGIGLAHRRLSIVDLSPAGHQPMRSADGRFVLTYNGEIYNHSEIRAELDRKKQAPAGGWRGHSDTETLLHAIRVWGLEAALERSVGMFAFALWDAFERKLFLARDRFGEKPLYYGWVGGDFVFGSELKGIRAHPRFSNEVDRRSLATYSMRTYIPAPLSIYKGIFKLEPGCVLEISGDGASQARTEPPAENSSDKGVELRRYWDYADVVRRGLDDSLSDEREAIDRVEAALGTAIRGQSIADVPVGAFLSGGLDSSTVVALYQKHSAIPVRTFSIGFHEPGFNEAEHAKAIARHLGTIHHEQYIAAEQAREVIPLLPSIYDEPFADTSQIPTFLVSRFARSEVTVALTGDGGDELFGGYRRHVLAPKIWQSVQPLPFPIRSVLAKTLSSLPSSFWTRVAFAAGKRGDHWGGVIRSTLTAVGASRSFDDLYRSYLTEWPFQTPPAGPESAFGDFRLNLHSSAADEVRAMYCDAMAYLPDDILCKVDRASMAVSLETRVPFLDHRLAEVAARVPTKFKFAGREGKMILRKLLGREIPRELFDRPKAGFSIPISSWLKGPLKEWAENLLDERRLAEEGWFDVAAVRRRWRDHLNGRLDSAPAIWAVLMFQAWLDEQQSPVQAAS
jgi:asparagine synthase (glutamine-hydrolysing)